MKKRCSHASSWSAVALAMVMTMQVHGCKARSHSSATKDVLVGESDVLDQGQFGFCTFYAMATFLSLWNNVVNDYDKEEANVIWPAFLSLGMNRLFKSGSGVIYMWLMITTQKYGVTPQGAKFLDGRWPMSPNWEREYEDGLMDTAYLDRLLTSEYRVWNRAGAFTPKQYFATIGINFADFRGYLFYKPELTIPPRVAQPSNARYRAGSFEASNLVRIEEAKTLGIDPNYYKSTAEGLYEGVVRQLYGKRPVLLSINAGLAENMSKTEVFRDASLKTYGKGSNGRHAVVALAHCNHPGRPRLDICRTFDAEMLKRGVAECVVIQNSAGLKYHVQGRFCVSKTAASRLFLEAFLHKDFRPPQSDMVLSTTTEAIGPSSDWYDVVTTEYESGDFLVERAKRAECLQLLKTKFPDTKCFAMPDTSGFASCRGTKVASAKTTLGLDCIKQVTRLPYKMLDGNHREI